MIGHLAQAIDEAIPDGATGFGAAKAVVAFLNSAGYVIVPKEPTALQVVSGKHAVTGHLSALSAKAIYSAMVEAA